MEIIVKNISKSFAESRKKITIFDKLSYKFESGKLYLLRGESGKGKSTLLSIIGLLQDSDSGEILFDGQKVNNINREKQCTLRRENIGFVFQDYNLFDNLNVIDNVTLIGCCLEKNKDEVIKKAEELLIQFGLKDRIKHKANELSGGEKQRVSLVRAILNSPEILICDEPVSNLDKENAEKIASYINDYCHTQNKIVIVSTHDNSFVDYADEVIEL